MPSLNLLDHKGSGGRNAGVGVRRVHKRVNAALLQKLAGHAKARVLVAATSSGVLRVSVEAVAHQCRKAVVVSTSLDWASVLLKYCAAALTSPRVSCSTHTAAFHCGRVHTCAALLWRRLALRSSAVIARKRDALAIDASPLARSSAADMFTWGRSYFCPVLDPCGMHHIHLEVRVCVCLWV